MENHKFLNLFDILELLERLQFKALRRAFSIRHVCLQFTQHIPSI